MLTPRQRELYAYLADYVESLGVGPSYEEIRKHLGVGSLSRARARVAELRELGVVEMKPRDPRSIRVVPLR